MRLNGIGGDGNDVTLLAVEGGGKSPEEAGRHKQEVVALNVKDGQNDKLVED